MLKRHVHHALAIAWVLLLSVPVQAADSTPWNVIFITIDGVRYQEFFSREGRTGRLPFMNRPRTGFPKLWKSIESDPEKRIWTFGDPADREKMKISNPYAISTPGYQSIFTGESQGRKCKNNSCPQVSVETFPERLIREGGLAREDVVSISSWTSIAKGIESKPGTILGNYGNQEIPEPEMAEVNRAQYADPSPWTPARWDKYTQQYALWFLKTKQPRFLHIGLNDTDEYAHERQYDKYVSSLRQYDDFFQDVLDALKETGEYGRNTALIITTDHGRGKLFFWNDHSRELCSAHRVFGVLRMPDAYPVPVRKASGRRFEHSDLRPTIETLLGLEPLEKASGRVLFKER